MTTTVETYSGDRGEQYNSGQFFTPVDTVNMLLDKLPHTIWGNEDFKWLEPSFGEGVFIKEIIKRLLKHHDIKHILENMIFGIELDAVLNREFIEYIEYTYGLYMLNLPCVDTLSFEGGITFDVIIGNPPFNSRDKTIRNSKILHQKFTEFCMDNLNEGGLLLFIIPPIYRRRDHILNYLWKKKQMLYIHMFSRPEIKQLFGVSANIDCIILENVERYKNTVVRFITGDTEVVDFSEDIPYIPNGEFNLFKSLLNSRMNRYVVKSGGGRRTDQQDEEDEEHPYKTFMSRSNRRGKRFRWSSSKRADYDLTKVIINQGTTLLPFYNDGGIQCKDHAFYIEVDNQEEGDALIEFIMSADVQLSSKYWIWSSFAVEAKCLEYIL